MKPIVFAMCLLGTVLVKGQGYNWSLAIDNSSPLSSGWRKTGMTMYLVGHGIGKRDYAPDSVVAISSFRYMVIRGDKVIEKGKIDGGLIPLKLNERVRDNDIVIYYDLVSRLKGIPGNISLTVTVPFSKS